MVWRLRPGELLPTGTRSWLTCKRQPLYWRSCRIRIAGLFALAPVQQPLYRRIRLLTCATFPSCKNSFCLQCLCSRVKGRGGRDYAPQGTNNGWGDHRGGRNSYRGRGGNVWGNSNRGSPCRQLCFLLLFQAKFHFIHLSASADLPASFTEVPRMLAY